MANTEKNKPKVRMVDGKTNFTLSEKNSNSGFAFGRIKIAYAGDNRNYSSISREVFDKAEASLIGVPVVGNWTGKNFGGHDVIIETNGNEWIVRDKTIPLGFVPESSNIQWEEVADEDGNIKLYVTTDVVLWEHRNPDEVQFIREYGVNHSMEIGVNDGEWQDDGHFVIKDFEYQALCLLGVDTPDDEDGNVEPCFEDSNLELSYSKDFNDLLSQMKKEFSIQTKDSQQSGGEEAVEITKEQYELLQEELKVANEALRLKSEEFIALETKFNDLMDEHSNNLVELESLREFKAEIELNETKLAIEEVKEQYSMLLDEKVIESALVDGITPDELRQSLAKVYANQAIEALANADDSLNVGIKTFGRIKPAAGESTDPYKIK